MNVTLSEVTAEHANEVASLVGTTNQDWTVLETRPLSGAEFVALAYRRDHETARNEYVTWHGDTHDGRTSYYWGHYDLGAGALSRAAADFESR